MFWANEEFQVQKIFKPQKRFQVHKDLSSKNIGKGNKLGLSLAEVRLSSHSS